MIQLATCYNYSSHTIYTDGRLYRCGVLLGTYATEAAAKAVATRNNKRDRAQQAAEHHARIARIHGQDS